MQKSDRAQALKREIDARVAAYFSSSEPVIGLSLSPNGEHALQLLAEFTKRPSKRLRGILAVVAYEAFGGKDHSVALDAALAMELAQSYLLIIDDVMDRSQTRRGGPTVHREYLQQLRQDFPARHITHNANMAAVVLGELAQHVASTVLNAIDAPAERVLRAEKLFHINLAATGHGQLDDLFGSIGQSHSIAETLAMYVRKTCYYTFINPLQTGAALAGASEQDLQGLYEFGLHAGVAFQLEDDDIGMFGDAKLSGKSAMDDLREGKMTVLMRHALSVADGDQLHTLQSALGNKAVTTRQHAAVKSVLEDIGSRAFARSEMERANLAALKALAVRADWGVPFKQFLQSLLEQLTNRVS